MVGAGNQGVLACMAAGAGASARRAAHGCVKCGRQAAWESLPLLEELPPALLRTHLLHWPHDLRVQVRRCTGCGAPTARLVGQ
jgi:hypothetical protein